MIPFVSFELIPESLYAVDIISEHEHRLGRAQQGLMGEGGS